MTGLVPIAISFDGGGSIRIPVSFSGAFGLGPTFGRVPCDTDDLLYLGIFMLEPTRQPQPTQRWHTPYLHKMSLIITTHNGMTEGKEARLDHPLKDLTRLRTCQMSKLVSSGTTSTTAILKLEQNAKRHSSSLRILVP